MKKVTAIYCSRPNSDDAWLTDVKIGKFEQPLQNSKTHLEYYYLPVPHSIQDFKGGQKVYLVLGDFQQPLGLFEKLEELQKFHSLDDPTTIRACTVSPLIDELVWM